ncbi:DNA replication licensing factor MCM4 [Gossypium arboreum]|uniref:DNA replication licensing factor MCM4 n=1 Tax=Gossypium arboreum TaxID=29729 RepID=A0A0B0PWT1_GOSAR|nr:DNA replication licensing factor MCM4 [Gossypium arboreum]
MNSDHSTSLEATYITNLDHSTSSDFLIPSGMSLVSQTIPKVQTGFFSLAPCTSIALTRDVVDNDHNIIHAYNSTIRHSIHNKQ